MREKFISLIPQAVSQFAPNRSLERRQQGDSTSCLQRPAAGGVEMLNHIAAPVTFIYPSAMSIKPVDR